MWQSTRSVCLATLLLGRVTFVVVLSCLPWLSLHWGSFGGHLRGPWDIRGRQAGETCLFPGTLAVYQPGSHHGPQIECTDPRAGMLLPAQFQAETNTLSLESQLQVMLPPCHLRLSPITPTAPTSIYILLRKKQCCDGNLTLPATDHET